MPERYLGRTLGRFRVDAVIGSGGFAWVYKGYDPELEIPVALKVLKPQYAGDETFEERFRREAATAAKLRHPNIIKIYAVGRETDAVYFAMDYLPQGLADRLTVMSTLPEPLLIRMAVDVASALGYAHRAGVIHRDIKTDNILFDEHGNAVVADFGIARAVSGYAEQTGTNMVVGTPQYFSPEQARGLTLDGRADLYSLGVTLFKAATGQLPFQGTDWYEIARQHVEDRPPKPRSINPALSREMEELILSCLAKDPDDRPASGEAMVERLGQILQDRGESTLMRTGSMPASITLSTPVDPAWLRRRFRHRMKNPWWVGGGAAALLMAGVLVFRAGRAGTEAGATPASDPVGRMTAETVSAPLRRILFVDAPAGARVRVNGVLVGTGSWRSDTLRPGRYEVSAGIDAPADCPSRRVQRTITLDSAAFDTVRLQPRLCGRLAIDVNRDAATYFLTSLRDGTTRSGSLPLRAPMQLPVGEYQLRVDAPKCATYSDPPTAATRITAGERTRRKISLIC